MFSTNDIEKIARIRKGPTEQAILNAAEGAKNLGMGLAMKPAADSAQAAQGAVDEIAEKLIQYKDKKVSQAATAYGKRRAQKAIDSVSNASPRTFANAIGGYFDDLSGKRVKRVTQELDDAIHTRDIARDGFDEARDRYSHNRDRTTGLEYGDDKKSLFGHVDAFIRRQKGNASPLENANMGSGFAGIDMATFGAKRVLSEADIAYLKAQQAIARDAQDKAIRRAGYAIGGGAGAFAGYKADQAMEKRRQEKMKTASFSTEDIEKIAGVKELIGLGQTIAGKSIDNLAGRASEVADKGITAANHLAEQAAKKYDGKVSEVLGVNEAINAGVEAATKAKNQMFKNVQDSTKGGLDGAVGAVKGKIDDVANKVKGKKSPMDEFDAGFQKAKAEQVDLDRMADDIIPESEPVSKGTFKRTALGASAIGGAGIAGGAMLSNSRDQKTASFSESDMEKIAISLASVKTMGSAAKAMAKTFGDDAVKASKSWLGKADDMAKSHLSKDTYNTINGTMGAAKAQMGKATGFVGNQLGKAKGTIDTGVGKVKNYADDMTGAKVKGIQDQMSGTKSARKLNKLTDQLNTAKADSFKARATTGATVGLAGTAGAIEMDNKRKKNLQKMNG